MSSELCRLGQHFGANNRPTLLCKIYLHVWLNVDIFRMVGDAVGTRDDAVLWNNESYTSESIITIVSAFFVCAYRLDKAIVRDTRLH